MAMKRYKNDFLTRKPRRWIFHTPHQLFVAFLVDVLLAVGIILVLSTLSCASSPRGKIEPMENQLGSKLELQSVTRFGFDKVQIRTSIPEASNGLGYSIVRYNSREFMHERYYQFNFREPALSPFEWQINAKVKSYIFGKYGVLP